MSGTIQTGTHKINGVSTDYNFPDPLGDVQTHTDMDVDGVQTDYYQGPAEGTIEAATHKINGVSTTYWVPNVTGFGSSGGSGVITRNFTTLDPAFSMHYTIPTVTLTDDFEISMNIQTVDTGTTIIIGSLVSTDSFIALSTGGVVRVKVAGGAFVDTASGLVNDGKLHNIRVTRVSGNITIFVDGVSEATGSGNTGNFVLDACGRYISGLNFDGVISDVNITDAGTLIRDYPIDETWIGPSTVLNDISGNNQHGTAVNIDDDDSENLTQNVDGDWEGLELISNGDFSNGSTDWNLEAGWSVSSGEASATGSSQDLWQDILSLASTGLTYICRFDLIAYSSGALDFKVNGTRVNIPDTSLGFKEVIIIPPNADTHTGPTGSGFIGTVDNVSVKRFIEVAP